MKQRIYNGHSLDFYDSSNNHKAEIKISGNDLILNPIETNGTVIIGEAGSINDIEVGAVGTAVDFTFLGGGTLTSNGSTLVIGESGDTIDLSNTTLGPVSASFFTGSFIGDGTNLINVVPDLTSYTGNVAISGNLTVNGTTTTVNSTNLDLSDNIIGLNRGATSNANDSGIIIERGSTGNNAAILWDESDDRFTVGTTTSLPNATGNIAVALGNLAAGGLILSPSSGDVQIHFQDSGTTNAYIALDDGTHDMLFKDDSATVMAIDFNSERVGIGTVSPNEKLQVAGNIHAYAPSGIDAGLFASTAAGSTTIAVRPNGITHFNGGNVGIGTATPANTLHVNGTLRIGPSLTPDRDAFLFTTGGTLNTIQTNNENTNFDNNQGNIHIRTENNSSATPIERISILSDGKVGIGHSTLYQKFTVNGNIDVRGGDGCLVTFNNGDGGIGVHYNNTGTVGRDIAFKTFETGIGNTEKMRITKDGKIGIGTSSPVAKLHVYQNDTEVDTEAGVTIEQDGTGDAALSFLLTSTKRWRMGIDNSDSDKFKISDSTNLASSNRLTIDTSGNVGIGATSPNSKLDVRRAGNGVALELIQTSGNANDFIDLKMIAGNTTAGTLGTILRHKRDGSGGGDFSILTNPTLSGTPTEKLIVKSDGKVGIGTADPAFNFHVNSAAGGVTAIGVGNTGSGASRMYIDASNGDFAGSDYMWIGQNNDLSGEIFMAQNAGSFHIKTQPGGTSTSQFSITQAGIATFTGKIVPNSHIEFPYGGELRTLDSGGGVRTIARASSNKLQYGWSYNGAVEFMGGGSYTPRITIGTDGNTTFSNNVTVLGGLSVGDSNADTAQIGLKHLLGYCENTDVDTGTEDIKSLALSTYQAVFFDYLVKNGSNMRAGTLTAVHDGTTVKFNEVSTVDVGNTTDIKLNVVIDGSNLKLQATTLSNNWIVKANIRGIKV